MKKLLVVASSKITYSPDMESKIQKIRNLLNNFHGIVPSNGRSVRIRKTEDSVTFTGRYDFIDNPEMLDIFKNYGEESVTNFEIADKLYDGYFTDMFKNLFVPELQKITSFRYSVQTGGSGSVMYIKFRVVIDIAEPDEEGYEEE